MVYCLTHVHSLSLSLFLSLSLSLSHTQSLDHEVDNETIEVGLTESMVASLFPSLKRAHNIPTACVQAERVQQSNSEPCA